MRWRDIKGWEGFYQVSDTGEVRSLDRVVQSAAGALRFSGRTLRQHRHNSGYYHVALSRPGKTKTANVHVLVAEAFLPCKRGGQEVCHMDGTRTNNHYKNLRWGSRKSNAEDRKLHGTDTHDNAPKGEENAMSILTAAQVRRIRKDPRTLREIGDSYGVSLSTIHCVKKRKTWRHV